MISGTVFFKYIYLLANCYSGDDENIACYNDCKTIAFFKDFICIESNISKHMKSKHFYHGISKNS